MSASNEALVLGPDMVGQFHYTLTDDTGAVLDSSEGNDPMEYLHGHHNIIPGLEAAMVGKGAGAAFRATIPPAEAYGEKVGPGPQRVHRREFPKDFEPHVGGAVEVNTPQGPMTLWITKIEGAGIWLDAEHPLAGKTLHFDVQVVGVRAASAEELAHGHAHGPDGHHHHH